MKYISVEMDKFLKRKSQIDEVVASAKERVMSSMEFERLVSETNEIWGLKTLSRDEI